MTHPNGQAERQRLEEALCDAERGLECVRAILEQRPDPRGDQVLADLRAHQAALRAEWARLTGAN